VSFAPSRYPVVSQTQSIRWSLARTGRPARAVARSVRRSAIAADRHGQLQWPGGQLPFSSPLVLLVPGGLYAVVLVVRHLVLYLHAVAVLSEDPVGHSKDATCKGKRIAGFPNPIPKGSRDGIKRDLRGSVHLDKLELHRLRW
jgi:hypothetical protein